VTALTFEEPPEGVAAPAWVRLTGPDETACAMALLDAVFASSAELIALAPVPPTLHEVRTATEQLRIAAAWHARMHALPPAAPPSLGASLEPGEAAPPPAPVESAIEGHIEVAEGLGGSTQEDVPIRAHRGVSPFEGAPEPTEGGDGAVPVREFATPSEPAPPGEEPTS
jgi:hypothetical protein